MTLWYMVGFCKILVLYNVGSGVCAIVSQTILSHMLEDSSRAHSGDISKANSAVTANAENPFITLKRLFSPVGTSTRRLFCIQVSVFGTVFNILEHRADNVSVQYWIYLIPPDWVARHTRWIRDQTEISYWVQNWSLPYWEHTLHIALK